MGRILGLDFGTRRIGAAISDPRRLIATPLEVYDRPASLFCAAFIGSPPMNLIEVEVADGKLRGQGGLALAPPPGLPRDRRLVAGVRP